MHAVLEGVIKTLLCKFWMKGCYKDFRFYLGREVKDIDKLLLSIKPPHEFRRSPRPIETIGNYWKASEFRAFLLIYAIPILVDFLPIDYVYHLNLLVKSVHILLSSSIHSNELLKARDMLATFYRTILCLYPDELCTMNVHSLIHLCGSVQRCGPLWSYSCFGFESMNGHLKKHCHGTRNVLPQLVRNLRLHQNISDQHSTGKGDNRVLGRVKHTQLRVDYIKALEDAQFSVLSSTLPVFSRYRLEGVVYQVCNSGRLRNSATCKFKKADGSVEFGTICCFCFCNRIPVAIISTFSSVKDLFDGLQPSSIRQFDNLSSCVFISSKLSTSSNLIAVPVSLIVVKCVHISNKSKPFDYIIPLPNSYEHH